MSNSIIRKLNSNDAYDKFTTATNSSIFSVGVNDSADEFIINVGHDSLSTSGVQAFKVNINGTVNIGHAIADGQTIQIGQNSSTGITLAPSENAISEKITITNGGGDAADSIKLTSGGGITLEAGSTHGVIVSDNLSLKSDSAVLAFGANLNTTLTHTDGTGLILNLANKLCFRDSSIHINSLEDGYMNIEADAGINIRGDGNDIVTFTTATTTVTATTASTSKTSGALVVSGGVGIATDLVVGENLKLTSESAVISFGASDDITLTNDDGTGATLATSGTLNMKGTGNVQVKSDSGTITLDAETDVILDAKGNNIILKDDGTTFGSFTNSSGNLVIKSSSSSVAAMTFSGSNVAIAGSLSVIGNMTTVDVSNTKVIDNMIILNTGMSGSNNTNDVGILFERGNSGNNGFVGWDETAERFVTALTDASEIEIGNIVAASEHAPLQVSTLYASDITDASKITINNSSIADLNDGTAGQVINVGSMVYRDTTTTDSSPNTTFVSFNRINRPTISAAESDVTINDSATFYIENSPTTSNASGQTPTLCNGYSIYVASGLSRFDTVTAASVTTTSDINLKTNISQITGALDKVVNMRGIYFDWIDQQKYSDRKQLGFIAQEVESVVPELVSSGESDIKSVNYAQTVALLLEAIKDQNTIINQLKADVEELKSKVN